MSRFRIDARPKSSVSSQAGIRNAHYGMGGKLIGGYAEGRGFGTKANGGRGEAMPSASTGTAPATGNRLSQRQSLFRNMEKAGANGMTDDMRQQARSLGVGDEAFNAAAGRIKSNAAAIAPVYGSQPAAQQPSQPAAQRPQPVANAEPKTQWEMDRFQRVQKQNEMRKSGVNPQTGMAMGADAPAISPANGKLAAPKYGADIAKANIASMGADGAAADYFKRAAAEKVQVAANKSAETQSKFRQATAITPPNSLSTAPPMGASPFPSPVVPAPAPAPKEVQPMMVGGKPMDTSYGTRISPEDQAKRAAADTQRREISAKLNASRQPIPQAPASPAVPSLAASNLSASMGNTSNDTFRDPAAEAKKSSAMAKAKADAEYAKNNEAIRKRRESQSSGIFASDSIAGKAVQWLQNDNFSGAEKKPAKPAAPNPRSRSMFASR